MDSNYKNKRKIAHYLDVIAYDDRSQQHPKHIHLPTWLPKHEFLMLIIAPAGSGKTTLLLNILLRIYKRYWHQIFVFSPTIHNDGKWEHLKNEKNLLMKPLDKGNHLKRAKQPPKDKNTSSLENKEDLPSWLQKENEEAETVHHIDIWNTAKSNKKLSKKAIFSKKHGPPIRTAKALPHQEKVHRKNETREETIAKWEQSQKRRGHLRNQLQKPLTPLEDKLWRDMKSAMFKNIDTPESPTQEETEHTPKKDKTIKHSPQSINDHEMFEEYTDTTLDGLIKEQDNTIKHHREGGKNNNWIHKIERTLYVFDDMVGSGLFTNKRNNAFKRLTVRRRHLFSSVIGVTQAYKEIPKTTRTNANTLILFHIDNEEELNAIYQEFPMGLKMKEWQKLVEWATTTSPFSFIMFNTQQSNPDMRITLNFTHPLPLQWIKQHFATTQSAGSSPSTSTESSTVTRIP